MKCISIFAGGSEKPGHQTQNLLNSPEAHRQHLLLCPIHEISDAATVPVVSGQSTPSSLNMALLPRSSTWRCSEVLKYKNSEANAPEAVGSLHATLHRFLLKLFRPWRVKVSTSPLSTS